MAKKRLFSYNPKSLKINSRTLADLPYSKLIKASASVVFQHLFSCYLRTISST